jgi:outer membrane biosynthesis protein TonB
MPPLASSAVKTASTSAAPFHRHVLRELRHPRPSPPEPRSAPLPRRTPSAQLTPPRVVDPAPLAPHQSRQNPSAIAANLAATTTTKSMLSCPALGTVHCFGAARRPAPVARHWGRWPRYANSTCSECRRRPTSSSRCDPRRRRACCRQGRRTGSGSGDSAPNGHIMRQGH